MFYEQLNAICKSRGTTPTALVKNLGYSTSKVTAWKNGSIPKADILQKLASALDVHVNVLFDMDYTGPYSDARQKLIDRVKTMSDEEVRRVTDVVDYILTKREN